MNLKHEDSWVQAGRAVQSMCAQDYNELVVAFEDGRTFLAKRNKSGSITVWESD